MNILHHLALTLTSILCHALCQDLESILQDLYTEDNLPGLQALLNSAPTHSIRSEEDVYSSKIYAEDFLNDVNNELRQWKNRLAVTKWNYETNITEYNLRKNAENAPRYNQWYKRRRAEAQMFHLNALPDHLRRQLVIFTQSASPQDPDVARRITVLSDTMRGVYGSGHACLRNGSCLALEGDLVNIMGNSRDPELLQEAWVQWREAVGPEIKDSYVEFIRLLNIGAVENGYSDFSEAWKETEFFETPELDGMLRSLWQEVQPLYQQLHAYVRRKLREQYGPEVVGEDGTIPAHLLGNMWAQHWTSIFDIVNPFPGAGSHSQIEERLRSATDVNGMFRLAENFYRSLGFLGMTPTFWEKSMLTKPSGREVECHGSSFDMYYPGDFRIKMCTEVTMDDFRVVHHEMGHVEYFMSYADQPTVFREGANAAFHEAVGDTIGLSVLSFRHLQALGLVDSHDRSEAPETSESLGEELRRSIRKKETTISNLLKMALEKVAFLPFGLLIDIWRWEVMQGETTPDNYNQKWWEKRLEYQGMRSPVPRSENDFDPGAKYHIPANSPYVSYFISYIQQFQMYKAMCEESGHQGPLSECDFYGSRAAGNKLRHMLSLGMSTSWQSQLRFLTGNDHVTADAIKEYFKPLYDWLIIDNDIHGEEVGWQGATINWRDE